MTGPTKKVQQAWLDSTTIGFNRQLYLHLLYTTFPAGTEPLDDGSMLNLTEVPTSILSVNTGYQILPIAAGLWQNVSTLGTIGVPTTKQLPALGGAPIAWLASADWPDGLTAWCFTDDNVAVADTTAGRVPADHVVASGPMVDVTNTPVKIHLLSGQTFRFTDVAPLVIQLGDPQAGTQPL